MAPKYTLHYFDSTARGDPIRLAFHYAGVEFTDTRYQLSDLPKIKANTKLHPLGQLPTIEVDDEVICQSHAVLRYLGNEFNLCGKTNKDKAIIDQVLISILHMDEELFDAYFWKPLSEKEERLKNIFAFGTRTYELMEDFLKKNGNTNGFLVGNEISIVDLHLIISIEVIQLEENLPEHKNFLDAYPLVKKLNERIRNVHKIKEFLEKRGPPNYRPQRAWKKANC